MAAAVLRELGGLWIQNLRTRGTLTLGLPSCPGVLALSHVHTSAPVSGKWEKKNTVVYPPQQPGEPRRPAEIYHCRRQIKYSKDKMWYLAKLIRGMSIDQALAQLEFSDKKGAQIIKEVLLQAQDMAVKYHNVEFRSNLYVDSLALNLRGRPRKLLVDGALVILTIPGTLLVSFHCRKLSVSVPLEIWKTCHLIALVLV